MFSDPLLKELQSLYLEAKAMELRDPFSPRQIRKRMYSIFQLASGRSAGQAQELNSKKSFEANRFLNFALNYKKFPDGFITISENPDFLVKAEKTIGIEMTDVYVELSSHGPEQSGQGNMLKMQEHLKDAIARRGKELFAQEGGPSLHVRICFKTDTRFKQADILRVAELVSKCVPHEVESSKEAIVLHRNSRPSLWPAELDRIIVMRRPEFLRDLPHWYAAHGGNVFCSEQFIQNAIDRKEKKLHRYRLAGCDELWLLLVVENFTQASFMELPKETHSFSSSFDRVVAFSLADDEIAELKCNRPVDASELATAQ